MAILTLLALITGTGGLIGILGYGAYTTVKGQQMNNVRAMGYRVTAQFGLVAAGLAFYCVNVYGTPSEMYHRYQTTGKIFAHSEHVQAGMVRSKVTPHYKEHQNDDAKTQ